MINLNGIYFDKIRTARVVRREHTEWTCNMAGSFPESYSQWFDVEVNGEDLGLQLDKHQAEEWLTQELEKLK